MKKIIRIASVMMLLVIYSHNSFAQDKTPADNNGNNALQDSLAKLKNEEYNAYFDSIYDVQLPQVQIVNPKFRSTLV